MNDVLQIYSDVGFVLNDASQLSRTHMHVV